MASIIPFNPVDRDFQADIQYAAELLKETGSNTGVTSFAIVFLDEDQKANCVYSTKQKTIVEVLGAIESLKQTIIFDNSTFEVD